MTRGTSSEMKRAYRKKIFQISHFSFVVLKHTLVELFVSAKQDGKNSKFQQNAVLPHYQNILPT